MLHASSTVLCFLVAAHTGQAATNAPAGGAGMVEALTLRECLRRVLESNETVQMRALDWEVSRKRHAGEKGIFEPELVGSIERDDRARANTVEQARSQSVFGASSVFNERNTLYNWGVEALQPSGMRVRIGYSLRDLNNNLNAASFPGGEYESSVGLTLTQPLLKNSGVAVNTANIRLAAIGSEAAFQDYRKQFMQVVAGTESAYWNLHLAQEQLRLTQESVALAETILADNRTRLAAGKATELDVLQGLAGVVFRRARQAEAEQKVVESADRLASFFGVRVAGAIGGAESRVLLQAADKPEVRAVELNYGSSMGGAMEANPDYLSRRKQIEAQKIRLAYAENQRWPQLDLKASYGLNGLGNSPGGSFDQITRTDFPFWTVGLEMRLPLEGGIKTRADRDAAQLLVKQALLGLKEVETQMSNALDSALRKVRNAAANVTSYQTLADYTKTLLDAQIDRLNAGKSDSRTVLETEEKLFEARAAVVESLVQFQVAILELELVQGATLRLRNLDLTQKELSARTLAMLPDGRVDKAGFERLKREAAQAYDKGTTPVRRTAPVQDTVSPGPVKSPPPLPPARRP